MQIERLEYFIKVADAQSINSASYELHISQQALNQSMTNLEKEMDVALFERSSKGIRLTDKGMEFYKVALEIVETWNQFKSNFYQLNNLSGHYNIGIVPYVEVEYYSTFITAMENNYPKIQIDTISAFNDELIDLLIDKSIDIAVTNYKDNPSLPPIDPSIEFVTLNKKKVDVLVGMHSPLASQTAIGFDTIRQYPIALQHLGGNNAHNVLLNILKKNNCERITLYNSISTVHNMVAKGAAISFITEKNMPPSATKNKLVRLPLDEDFYMVKSIAFRKPDYDTDPVLVKIAEELCAKLNT